MVLSESEIAEARARVGGRYAWYVLYILILVYAVNYIDRQILSILAEDIKADLGLSDAEIGFLHGTVFAVSYSLFAIPLGRLADNWNRVRLLSIGLAGWSMMTLLSGFARNFGQLGAARIGVAVGQATSGPAAFSIISDYFPREKRATVISIYSAGLYLGAGLSLFLGGIIVNRWSAAFPEGGPLGLVGWQATFLLLGLPGLLLALWLATVREPIRGISENILTPPAERFFAETGQELVCILPPLTFFHVARFGWRALLINLGMAALALAFMAVMTWAVGNGTQWVVLGVAGYAVATWVQSLGYRDRPTHTLIWKTPAFVALVTGFGLISMIYTAIGFWAAPYAIRELGADKAVVGFFLGGNAALGGFLSVIIGGRLSDHFRLTNPSGRLLVVMASIVLPVPFVILQYSIHSELLFYVLAFAVSVLSALWAGAAVATVQDLVLPRMRGAATASYILGATIIGLGLGPFLAGLLSELLGDLGHALIALVLLSPLPLICILYGYRHLPAAESSRVERARAAGESI